MLAGCFNMLSLSSPAHLLHEAANASQQEHCQHLHTCPFMYASVMHCKSLFADRPRPVMQGQATVSLVLSFQQIWQSTEGLIINPLDSHFSCQNCHQMLQNPVWHAATLATALVPMLTTVDYTVQVSKACTSICMWARAMHKYHTVALSVAPKRAALAQAQGQLDATLAELAAAQAKLQARLP